MSCRFVLMLWWCLTFYLQMNVYFSREFEVEVDMIKNILTTYEASSGQAISPPKYEVYHNTPVEKSMRISLTQILGVQVVLGTCKYSGLPSMIGINKQATFGYIKDQIYKLHCHIG